MTLLADIGAELRASVRAATPSVTAVAFDNTPPLDASFVPTAVAEGASLLEFQLGSGGAGEPLGLGARALWRMAGRATFSARVPVDEGEDAARTLLETVTDALGPASWPQGAEAGAASIQPGFLDGPFWRMDATQPWTVTYQAVRPVARRLDLGGTFPDIGTALRDTFIGVVGADLGLTVEVPNTDPQSSLNPSTPYLVLFPLPGQREAVAGDGDSLEFEELGLVQLSSYWPLFTGADQALAAVDSVIDLVRGLRAGAVTFGAPYFETVGVDGEHWRLDVIAPYTARTAEAL
ncbi:hypothetical protein [Engelhardtia mirabilis]|uniref:Uncharacterized protein n=1 Tax=Engelhardtia mirabilis TaxID=2528011 RepID=A0A518BL56_9BACT|nr:hypothetical protein Pla133_27980 [Planctomycetes bacterium Pla133]QDV02036.1 hypothetical protein Pla86_27970 [Planctomycetes bacterium Pla86]